MDKLWIVTMSLMGVCGVIAGLAWLGKTVGLIDQTTASEIIVGAALVAGLIPLPRSIWDFYRDLRGRGNPPESESSSPTTQREDEGYLRRS